MDSKKVFKKVTSTVDKLFNINKKSEEEKKEHLKKIQKLSNAANKIFNTEEGLAFLVEMMRLCEVYDTKSYLGSDLLHFREGKRSVYINGFEKVLNPEIIKKAKEKLNEEVI